MRTPPLSKLLLVSAIAMALTACGGDDDETITPVTPPVTVPPPAASVGDTIGVTVTNKVVSFNLAAPGTEVSNVRITGMQETENVVGIDYRPADGQLYALGSNARIYTLNPQTGVATFKVALSADATDTTLPFTTLTGTDFGVDFNPAADRLRVTGNLGQNLRINVDTGATTTDGVVNGGAAGTQVTSSAYTNSFAGTATTTLYVIDAANANLHAQNPPNNGTLATPVKLNIVPTSLGGFDIDARNNRGYAVMTVGGSRGLYAVDLAATANPVALVATMGNQEEFKGMALKPAAVPMVYGLTDNGRMVGLRAATPGTLVSDVAITGMATGERMLGADVRPADGLVWGLGSNGRLYTVDPATGVATFKVALAADAADLTLPFAALVGANYAVDFNPVANRLRVLSDAGQSLRINVDTGATTTDGAVNRLGALPVVTGGAYTNSFAGTASTALMVLDTDSDNLALVNPPNDGTLANVGPLGVNAAGDVGFDIAGGANGLALAALRAGGAGASLLYRIDLATGAAVPVNGAATPATSTIGNGSLNVIDVVISLK
jgi:hypothetical protein